VRLLPGHWNDPYRGRPIGWQLLLLLALLNFVRGGIHLFADDGGAGRIAGIDLAQGGAVIVMLFAVMGIDQIVWGAIDAAVALRWRAFVPAVWAVTLAKQLAGALVMWVYKPLPVPAPGKFAALITLPVLAFALWASLRPAQASSR
jgi:hypothetical protein